MIRLSVHLHIHILSDIVIHCALLTLSVLSVFSTPPSLLRLTHRLCIQRAPRRSPLIHSLIVSHGLRLGTVYAHHSVVQFQRASVVHHLRRLILVRLLLTLSVISTMSALAQLTHNHHHHTAQRARTHQNHQNHGQNQITKSARTWHILIDILHVS